MLPYEQNVFINCPFDAQFLPLFHALVFTVYDCGYIARCALEVEDSGQVRIQKIQQIIAECRYGIHDISRTELDELNRLPRFNMPLELGLFLGATWYGDAQQRTKTCKILDTERFRFQKFCSDIAGQDISAHEGNPERAIKSIRDWLRSSKPETPIPGASKIIERYLLFRKDLPLIYETLNLREEDLTFIDFQNIVVEWLTANSWQ